MFKCIRTDLATELREKFEESVDINGVAINKRRKRGFDITTIDIKTDSGAAIMEKPKGRYVSIECIPCVNLNEKETKDLIGLLSDELKVFHNIMGFENTPENVLIIGIGNRNITSDSIGPRVVDGLKITRHLKLYFPEQNMNTGNLSAIIPGVMAQTGMESSDIIKAVCEKIKPELVIVIDSLASRSMSRLNATFQITDTGICPGAGLGNLRNRIDKDLINTPVIAIGVPTVVEAKTILYEGIEKLSENLSYDIDINEFMEMMKPEDFNDKYVTTKNIDEEVVCVSRVLQTVLNRVYAERK